MMRPAQAAVEQGDKLVRITLEFYRRNYIEGLFLSSGIIQSSDYTMEHLVRVARTLRQEHGFQGYIHLKTIPEAAPELIAEAGKWADRLSINIELPTQASLDAFAPEKELVTIKRSMAHVRDRIQEAEETRPTHRGCTPTLFARAGQRTQMIVGADAASDAMILETAASLYKVERLRRVYYSAFSPIPNSSSILPPVAPPLVREHRLYQADWLIRFYGFHAAELTTSAAPNLDLTIDPKLSWALSHREDFPVDLNRAPRELLLRIPGIGVRSVDRIVSVRKHRHIRLDDLPRLRIAIKRALPFVVTKDYNPSARSIDQIDLRARVAPARTQLDLFATQISAVHGEL